MGKPSSDNADVKWRVVPMLSDYEVSEFGGIRRATRGRTRLAGHQPRGHWSGGYLSYKLMRPDGSKGVFRAHRLVLLAFVGPPPVGKPAGLHNDGDKQNNHVSNLRWGDDLDNQRDAAKHGSRKGEKNGRARLTAEKVAAARERFQLATDKSGLVAQIARENGVSHSAMRKAINGQNW